MVAVSDVTQGDVTAARKKAHYLLIVPAPPKPSEPAKPKDVPEGMKPKGVEQDTTTPVKPKV